MDTIHPLPRPADLEHLAVEARITMAEACRRAGLTPGVFSRWKRGGGYPTIGNVQSLLDVLRDAIAKRDAAAGES